MPLYFNIHVPQNLVRPITIFQRSFQHQSTLNKYIIIIVISFILVESINKHYFKVRLRCKIGSTFRLDRLHSYELQLCLLEKDEG